MEKKLFFLSTDIEGVTDVTHWDDAEKGKNGYDESAKQMTAEVAAACRAILDTGNDVIVRDGHWTARNIIHRDLPRGVRLMRGWASHPGSMVAGIDEKYAGLLFVGYHSPGGSNTNPLAHTMDNETLAYMTINGRLASEFTINRYFAATYGVAPVFLSGDKGMCDLAKEECPDIGTVAVKECKGDSTFNMHPLDACDAIYEEVKKAVMAEHAAPVLPEEFDVVMRLIEHSQARKALWIPGVELVDDNTIHFIAKTPSEMNFIRSYAMS